MDKLRVVHCGCGGVSQAWLGSASMKELVEVVGLVDIKEEAARARRASAGLPDTAPVGTDLAAMIRQTRPEAVFDCTIPEAHHDVTTTALRLGCHVLGEKPMAASMEQARAMVAAAQASGTVYAVTQTRRWNAESVRAQRFLHGGGIGRVHTLFADFVISAHFGGFREEMKHVLLLDMAIHSFDTARQLIGTAKPEWVQAIDWNPPGSNYRDGASAIATFGFSHGVMLNYRGTWTANGRDTSWECDWNVQGTEGALTWRGQDGLVAVRRTDMNQKAGRDGGKLIRETAAVPVPDLSAAELADFRSNHNGAIRDFVLALRQGRAPECPAADNIHSLGMVLAAIASAEAGGVRLPVG